MPSSVLEGNKSDQVPPKDLPDDERTLRVPSHPQPTTVNGALFRPSSEWSAREWQDARAEVQRRWPRQNRWPS